MSAAPSAHRATGRRGTGAPALGLQPVSHIATLREEGRLPIRSVQWYLHTVHHLRLSVEAIHRTAQRAQPAVAAILDHIRASPVVHATGRKRADPRNLAGNPYSPEIVIFLASISVAMMGCSNGFHT